MGACQDISPSWHKFSDIIQFALQLPYQSRIAFLLVVSAVCWSIWKHRNDLCFNAVPVKSTRQIIFLILSLIHYWTGNVKPELQALTALWLPIDTDEIPISSWHPDDDYLMVVYGGEATEEND